MSVNYESLPNAHYQALTAVLTVAKYKALF